ncbi:hypothetical protein [Paenibacillus sp. YAF4_2]
MKSNLRSGKRDVVSHAPYAPLVALDFIQRNSELDVHILAYVGFRTVE